jgi:TetR/AcrR family transcriptional regulator, regulator of cefoperazone and chloramphenicol sensitivity
LKQLLEKQMSPGSAELEDGTRQRLLEAAGEVFAEHGFRAATIRDICGRAGVNIAAVNYHFRDKEGLYESVLQYAHRHALETYPPQPPTGERVPPEERLRVYIHSLLKRVLDQGRPAWHGKLMAREIVEPTGALDALVGQSIRPLQEVLRGIIRELIGRNADDRSVRLCAISVVGQCIHFYLARPVLQRLNPDLKYSPEDLEMIAEHVTAFSLAAIRHLPNEGQTS